MTVRSTTVVLGAVAVLVGVGVILVARIRTDPHSTSFVSHGFEESAEAVGLDFRMTFLSGEQGVNFKINLYDHGCGVAVADYDGDGKEDIYFTNQLGPNGLYRNKGDATFENVTESAGVGLGDRVCVAATFADYDNDGKQDLFVTSTRGGNVLFHNEGGGKFRDATKSAGVEFIGHSQTAVFFDFDSDGLLDLFVTNTANWTTDELEKAGRYYIGPSNLWQLAASRIEHNILYRNNGNGTFANVTEKAGLKGLGWGGDVAVFDYDEDGRLDLLVTNMFGASQLYRNKGDGSFVDVTREVLGRTSWGAVGSKAFDYNNDGRLDLLIVDMHSDMWLPLEVPPKTVDAGTLTRKYSKVTGDLERLSAKNAAEMEHRGAEVFRLRPGEVVFGNTLFEKLDNGRFKEVSDEAGLETFWPWGIAVADFDNDGFEDVYLPSGMGYPWGYWPSSLMMNNGNGTFSDRASEFGVEPPPRGIYSDRPIGGQKATRSSRCAAVADFDGDGMLDLVVNNFNDRPFFFRNRFAGRNYIAYQLIGTKSNRDAIGAVVRLHSKGKTMIRQVNPAGGYLSQSSRTVHFGLGDVDKVERIEIVWPSGMKQRIDNPAINAVHRVTEPTP